MPGFTGFPALAANMPESIPIYRADGELCGAIGPAALQRMQAAGLIARVIKSRKGEIKRAIMVPRRHGDKPLPLTAYMGTRYSFLDRMPVGQCWDLKRLGGARWGTNYAPEEVRPIFLQVVRECLVPNMTRGSAAVARRTHNPQAVGSIPTPATMSFPRTL